MNQRTRGLLRRNARASGRVSIACSPAGLTIEVIDDGTGLHKPGQLGYGAAIWRERAEEPGGTVKSATSRGIAALARMLKEES